MLAHRAAAIADRAEAEAMTYHNAHPSFVPACIALYMDRERVPYCEAVMEL
jgi:hypothetical protein